MEKLTKYFLIFHTVILFIAGFGIWFILKCCFPTLLLNSYFIIPLFFYLMGIIFIWKFRHTSINKPDAMANVYMLMRMIKVFVSFLLILIYWLIDKLNIRSFATIFIIFYLINLVWETYIYLRMEKYLKFKRDQEKPQRERIDQ